MDREFGLLDHFRCSSGCDKKKIAAGTYSLSQFIWATNYCDYDGPACPRLSLPTGVGYDLCKSHHAEANLADKLLSAALRSEGVAWVFGHYYACEPCASALQNIGVREIRIRESR